MQILDFYRDWLTKGHGLVVSKDGFIEVSMVDGTTLPIIISADMGNGTMAEVPLVLPTEEFRKRGETGEYVRFHPLCESVFRGQSPVFNRLLATAAARYCKTFANLIYEAYVPLIDQSAQDKLSPELVDFASGIAFPKSAKSRGEVLKYMQTVMSESTGIKGTKYIVRFKAGRFTNTDKVSRNTPKDPMVAMALEAITNDHPGTTRYVVMTSALYSDALKVREGKLKAIFGKKARTQEILEAAADLIIAVFGDSPIYGCSGGNTAPFLKSLMLAMNMAAERNNHLANALLDSGAGAADVPVTIMELMDMSIDFDGLLKQFPVTCIGNVGTEVPTQNAAIEEVVLDAPMLTKPRNADTPPWEDSGKPLTKPLNNSQQQLTKKRTDDHIIGSAYQEKNRMAFNIRDTAEQSRNGATYVPPASMRRVATTKKSDPVETAGEEIVRERVSGRTIPASNSSTVQLKQAPAAKASPIRIKPAPERLIHLEDNKRNRLYCYDGSPYMVKESDVPKVAFEIEVNDHNEQVFNPDGTPSLVQMRVSETRGGRDAPRRGYERDEPRGRQELRSRQSSRDDRPMTMAERIRAQSDYDDDYDDDGYDRGRGRTRGRQDTRSRGRDVRSSRSGFRRG